MVANKARFMGPDLRRNQQMFDVPVRNVPSNFFEVAADLRMMRVSTGGGQCFDALVGASDANSEWLTARSQEYFSVAFVLTRCCAVQRRLSRRRLLSQ